MFLHPPPPSIALPAAGGARVQPTTISLRYLLYPPWPARTPQKPRLPRRQWPNRLLSGARYKGLTQSSPRARPRPFLPCLALRRPRPRRLFQTASPLGRAGVQQQQLVRHPLLSTMALGPAGPPGHLPDELQLCREPDGRGRLRPPPYSYRSTGPHGTTSVRRRPRGAYGSSSPTVHAFFW